MDCVTLYGAVKNAFWLAERSYHTTVRCDIVFRYSWFSLARGSQALLRPQGPTVDRDLQEQQSQMNIRNFYVFVNAKYRHEFYEWTF